MQSLLNTYRILLEITPNKFFRSYHSSIDWDNRLLGILGAKGVGKSTLMLQHIKKNQAEEVSLYVQADDFYFTQHRLFDLAQEFMSKGGRFLYIDEIHKYPSWSYEIKQIYDQLPYLNVVYSGSSILDLQRGGADLSRRTVEYVMTGLSFREYLNLSKGWSLKPASLEEILQGKVDFPYGEERPLKYFADYMEHGYYPFFQEPSYLTKLKRAIMVTVEDDLPHYAEMNIAARAQLKKLMYVLAQSAPFKPNLSSLERDLGIRRSVLPDYFEYLEKGRLISLLKVNGTGNAILRKPEKIYLDNPNIAYAISDGTPDVGAMRETVFMAWMKDRYKVYASPVSDFEIDGMTFEVGGKNKGKRQIATTTAGYVVKDDIEYAFENIVPLWMFGFAY